VVAVGGCIFFDCDRMGIDVPGGIDSIGQALGGGLDFVAGPGWNPASITEAERRVNGGNGSKWGVPQPREKGNTVTRSPSAVATVSVGSVVRVREGASCGSACICCD
jgi:hypothetical protein